MKIEQFEKMRDQMKIGLPDGKRISLEITIETAAAMGMAAQMGSQKAAALGETRLQIFIDDHVQMFDEAFFFAVQKLKSEGGLDELRNER